MQAPLEQSLSESSTSRLVTWQQTSAPTPPSYCLLHHDYSPASVLLNTLSPCLCVPSIYAAPAPAEDNPFASLLAPTAQPPQGPNTEALPNPWASPSTAARCVTRCGGKGSHRLLLPCCAFVSLSSVANLTLLMDDAHLICPPSPYISPPRHHFISTPSLFFLDPPFPFLLYLVSSFFIFSPSLFFLSPLSFAHVSLSLSCTHLGRQQRQQPQHRRLLQRRRLALSSAAAGSRVQQGQEAARISTARAARAQQQAAALGECRVWACREWRDRACPIPP